MTMDYDNNWTFQENMKARLQRGKQAASEYTAEARAKARRVVRQTDNYVHDYPWRVIGVASVIAFAIGALLPRKPAAKVVVKGPRPVIKKVDPEKLYKKHSGTSDLLKALIPVGLTIAKALQASRSKAHAAQHASPLSTTATAQPIP